MKFLLLFVILTLGHVSTSCATELGTDLLRTFFVEKAQPFTVAEAAKAGYTNYTGCVPNRGYAFSSGGKPGPDKSDSITIYYALNGQISGFGVRMWSDSPPTKVTPQFWVPNGDGSYDIWITTREPTSICSSYTPYTEKLGDRATISNLIDIPLTMQEAQVEGLWTLGGCINGMGMHHQYDLANPGTNTWNKNTLLPVTTMYSTNDGNALVAVLFSVPESEHYEPIGDWEGPFTNSLFCHNWCPVDHAACSNFPDVTFWSTMHFLFGPSNLQTCNEALC